MSEGERLDQLNRLLDDHDLPVTARLIGLLGPDVRAAALPDRPSPPKRRDDHRRSDQPAPRPARLDLPPEVAAVVHDHLAQIDANRNEAGHPERRWLFPSLQPGQPLHVFSAAGMLKEIGLPARTARNTACDTWSSKHRQRSSPTDSAPNAAQPPATPRTPAPTTPAAPNRCLARGTIDSCCLRI